MKRLWLGINMTYSFAKKYVRQGRRCCILEELRLVAASLHCKRQEHHLWAVCALHDGELPVSQTSRSFISAVFIIFFPCHHNTSVRGPPSPAGHVPVPLTCRAIVDRTCCALFWFASYQPSSLPGMQVLCSAHVWVPGAVRALPGEENALDTR